MTVSRRLRHWLNDHERGRRRFADVLLLLAAVVVALFALAVLLHRARA